MVFIDDIFGVNSENNIGYSLKLEEYFIGDIDMKFFFYVHTDFDNIERIYA